MVQSDDYAFQGCVTSMTSFARRKAKAVEYFKNLKL